jgi:hypothetical protein
MKVTITYFDEDALSIEEVVSRAKHNYGEFTTVEVAPNSNKPRDILYFALQQMVVHEQLSLLFDDKNLYPQRLSLLTADTMSTVKKELSSVLRDNEIKST